MPETRGATSRGLSLLGGWQLVVDGESVALGGREQRLCAFLALSGARPRAQVAGTLWPESTDARALASLRRALAQTHQRCPGLLAADRASVALAPGVAVDVAELRAAASRADAPEADATLLRALVGDRLLPGWYDEWVEDQRDELERQRVAALEGLSRRALERGDVTLAEDAARAVARLEPLRESASSLVIQALLGRDDRAGAVRELERYRDVVRTELGVVPSPALLALVEPPTIVVPAPRPAPVEEAVPPPPAPQPSAPLPLAPLPPEPPASAPLPPDPPSPPERRVPTAPAGSPLRAAASRLTVGAALVLATSLAVASLGSGADRQPPAPADDAARHATDASDDPGRATREVLVRPVTAAAGAAAFVVRATLRPARVRLVVGGPAGGSVVRSVVVRSSDGKRLVVDGLDGGTYQWSATSPTAASVTGQVRVADRGSVLVAAGEEPQHGAAPSSTSGSEATPTSTSPTSTHTETPPTTTTPSPTSTPTVTPTQPSPTQPSPTRHPSPPSGPTDPGTQDPAPVG